SVAAPLQMPAACDGPGNIRQLENAVFRAVVLADGPTLTAEEFPQIAAQLGTTLPRAEASPAAAPPVLAARPGETITALDWGGDVRPLGDVEADMIRLALERYGGRMALIARKLGIGRSTLYRKLRELGLADKELADN